MALTSMTGFARSDGGLGAYSWHWEVRSVNGRGLDIRLRLPPGYEVMEPAVREACKASLGRGNCTLTLNLQHETAAAQIRLNQAAFRQVAEAARLAATLSDARAARLDGLLAIKGVLEFSDADEDQAALESRSEAILADLDAALAALVVARKAEGAQLTEVIGRQIDDIEALVGRIEVAPGRAPEAIRTRLQEQLQRLCADDSRFDEQRLHQEAMLLAAKADVQEEIERLRAHVAAARGLLQAEEPVGRRLEFLAQELNRESNTICSKANDKEISQAGLALKAVVDRLREQVQNIE